MKNCRRSSFPITSPSSASAIAIAQKPSTDLVQEMRCVRGNDGRLTFSALFPKKEDCHNGEELEAVNSVQRLNVAVQHHHLADAESEEADEENGVGALTEGSCTGGTGEATVHSHSPNEVAGADEGRYHRTG